jgi:hypothetical protein
MERTRDLSLSERESVACMLARAFANDPLAQHVFPEVAIRRKRLVSVYRLYLRVFEQKGLVSINDDRSATALWVPPGQYPLSLTEHLLLLPRMMLGTEVQKLPAALRVLTHLEQMHPVGRRFSRRSRRRTGEARERRWKRLVDVRTLQLRPEQGRHLSRDCRAPQSAVLCEIRI